MFLVWICRQVPSEQKAHFSSKLQLNPVNTVLLPRQEKTQGVWKENSRKLRMELGAIVGVHWEVLAAQEMVPLFHGTFKEAIQVVNYIKRVFQKPAWNNSPRAELFSSFEPWNTLKVYKQGHKFLEENDIIDAFKKFKKLIQHLPQHLSWDRSWTGKM